MKDLTGTRYGRLVVEGFDELRKTPRSWCYRWRCRCDCGNIKIVDATCLKSGNTKSCGCLLKETSRKTLTKYDNETAFWIKLYSQYKRNSKFRKLEFPLSIVEFIEICKKNCKYCGAEPEERLKNKFASPFFASGIDRVDNSIGYTIENTVPCCTWCNYTKRHLPMKEFLGHCFRVAEWNREK